MRCRWILLVLAVVTCEMGSDAAARPIAPPQASWKIESRPVELRCGSNPLALPAPSPGRAKADRKMARAEAIKVCRGQASVAAVCRCLARSIKGWGETLGLSPAAECEPVPPASADAQLVEVSSKPAGDSTSAGEAFVFVARPGATFSPIAVIEAAPDVDLSVTPKASHTAHIDRVESKPIAGGTLFFIESHHEAQDKDLGDTDHDGEAHGTVCVVPAGAAPYCDEPLGLGTWSYAFSLPKADQPDACTITRLATYTARVTPTAVTVTLAHGKDDRGVAGRYRF